MSPAGEGRQESRLRPLALEDQDLIPVATALAKEFWGIWQLVVNLQAIAIGVMEVNALLTHMVYSPHHFDPLILQ
jgi:hypothetical protein